MEKILKNKYFHFAFILIISFMVCLPYFTDSVYYGHDILFHMNRIEGIKDTIIDGQLLPKVYPYTNNDFGYCVSLFYCDIFLIPFSYLRKFGVPLVICYKIMMTFFSSLSVISIFYVTKKIFSKNNIAPYISTILYSFSSYHLIVQYSRAAVGEVIALIFIPLVIYAIYKVLILKTKSSILLGTSFALLLLSHNISFVLYCCFFGISLITFTFLNIKDIKLIKQTYLTVIKGVLLALLLAAFFLMPMLEQFASQKFYLNNYTFMYDLSESIQSISSIFTPFVIINNDTFYQTMSMGLPLLFLSISYIFCKKDFVISFLVITNLFLLLMMVGIIPVHLLPIANNIQFLFRLYLIIFPTSVFVSLYVLNSIKSIKLKNGIILVIILWSLINVANTFVGCINGWRTYDNYAKPEDIYAERLSNGFDYNIVQISGAEYLPLTEDTNYLLTSHHIKEILPNTDFNEIIFDYEYQRNGTHIEFTYNSEESKLLMLPQTYYKGYQVFLIEDDGWTKLETINVPRYKQVGFYTLEGEHTYMSYYAGTRIQKISLGISSLTAITTLIYFIYKRRNKKNEMSQ